MKKMIHKVVLFLFTAMIAFAVSCNENPGKQFIPVRTVFWYECEDVSFTVKYEKKGAYVLVSGFGGERRLLKIESAQGVEYGDGEMKYAGKNGSVFLEYKGKSYNCVENVLKSILEDAKLRGVEFRATGNEPGWLMEISKGKIILYSDYATKKEVFDSGVPETGTGAGITVYNARNWRNKMKVVIKNKECIDNMSGESSELAVEYTLDGITYRGCGRALR